MIQDRAQRKQKNKDELHGPHQEYPRVKPDMIRKQMEWVQSDKTYKIEVNDSGMNCLISP